MRKGGVFTMWPHLFRVTILGSALLLCACGKDKATPAGDTAQSASEREPESLLPEHAAKVVARVGNTAITVGDVTEQINRLSPYIRRRWAAPEKRREFLQKRIRIELLAQEAIAQGLENDPEVQNTLKQVMIRLMVTNDLQNDYLPTAIEEAVLKREYEKELSKFVRPPEIRISQIVVATAEQAQKLIAEFASIKRDDPAFRERAREISLDKASAERGGDVGYFPHPEQAPDAELPVPHNVAEAAWQLSDIGEVAPAPVKTDLGYHVLRLTNKKPELNRSFESVKRLLENRLLREMRQTKMDEFVAELKQKATIEIYEDNLAAIRMPEPKDEAPVAKDEAPVAKDEAPPQADKKKDDK